MYILNAFDKNEYKSLIYLDFFKHPDLMQIFEVYLSPDEKHKKMNGSIPDINFVPGETLKFLDEIQCCGNARTAVKTFIKKYVLDCKKIATIRGIDGGFIRIIEEIYGIN